MDTVVAGTMVKSGVKVIVIDIRGDRVWGIVEPPIGESPAVPK